MQEATGVFNFANETKKLIGGDILISTTDFIGHMVLINRCYNVWGQNMYIIVVPFLTAVAGAGELDAISTLITRLSEPVFPSVYIYSMRCGGPQSSSSLTDSSAPMALTALVPTGIATYVLPLCTNAMLTALIAGRIWYQTCGFSEARSSSDSVQRAMIVILESGAVYLVTQLIFTVVYAIRHPAQGIVSVIAVQIYVRYISSLHPV